MTSETGGDRKEVLPAAEIDDGVSVGGGPVLGERWDLAQSQAHSKPAVSICSTTGQVGTSLECETQPGNTSQKHKMVAFTAYRVKYFL